MRKKNHNKMKYDTHKIDKMDTLQNTNTQIEFLCNRKKEKKKELLKKI